MLHRMLTWPTPLLLALFLLTGCVHPAVQERGSTAPPSQSAIPAPNPPPLGNDTSASTKITWERGQGEFRWMGFLAAAPGAPNSCRSISLLVPLGTSSLKLELNEGDVNTDVTPAGAGLMNATAVSPSGIAKPLAVDPFVDGGGPIDQASATYRHLEIKDPDSGTWLVRVQPVTPVVNSQAQLTYDAHGNSTQAPPASLLSKDTTLC